MNAIELAETLKHCWPCATAQPHIAAEMLLKQDAAIKQLREAVKMASDSLPDVGRVQKALKAALAATDEFK